MVEPEQLDADDLLGRSMKIDTGTDGPKVLVYHTHSQEEFKDSTPGDPADEYCRRGGISYGIAERKGG